MPEHFWCWHDDVIKWKHFPRYWPFMRGTTGHRWIPLTKASDAELWFFSVICTWTNDSANNRDTDDLKRHCAHYDVTVMETLVTITSIIMLQAYMLTTYGTPSQTGDAYLRHTSGLSLVQIMACSFKDSAICVQTNWKCHLQNFGGHWVKSSSAVSPTFWMWERWSGLVLPSVNSLRPSDAYMRR